MLTPIHVISDGDAKVFCRLNIFTNFGCVVNSRKECVCDADAESLSLSDILLH